jgi:hypothetical protein
VTADFDDDGLLDPEERDLGTFPIHPDTDDDGRNDGIDNCPTVANADQRNSDADERGNACDDDDDNDGLDDSEEFALGTEGTDPDSDDDLLDDFIEVKVLGTNPRSADTDSDSRPDGSDNCPTLANSNQADFDGDGAGDACDCDPLDATARTIIEVPSLAIAAVAGGAEGSALISWTPPTPLPGTAFGYDLVRGAIADLRASRDFTGAACLADRTAAVSLIDDEVPQAGGVFYYLVQIETSCGGTYGSDSAGQERLIPGVCPLTIPSQGDH